MSINKITICDATTGETVTREFNEKESAQLEIDEAKDKKELANKIKAEKVLTDKRQIILDRLGLTADEFAALLG